MDWTTIVTIITAVVALYGAVLSTYSLMADRREKARRISVRISTGFLTFGQRLSDTMVILEAVNPGSRSVTLQGYGIQLPDGKQVLLPFENTNVSFPYELAEGKNCTCWIGARELAAILAKDGYKNTLKLRAEFRDAVGNIYRSRRFKFAINEYLRTS